MITKRDDHFRRAKSTTVPMATGDIVMLLGTCSIAQL